MLCCIDMFQEKGEFSYFTETENRIITVPMDGSWNGITLSDPEEEALVSNTINNIEMYLLSLYDVSMDKIVFVVPYDFTLIQKKKLIDLAAPFAPAFCSLGIEHIAMYMGISDTSSADFYCNVLGDRAEFGIVETESDVIDIYGISGCRIKNWTEKEFISLKVQITQYMKDLNAGWSQVNRIIINGTVNNSLIQFFNNMTNVPVYTLSAQTTPGGVIHLLKLSSTEYQLSDELNGKISPLLLKSTAYDITVALGFNGEKACAVPRYTTIPTKTSVRLLVSTETVLHVYEGNYFNPRYDTELAAFQLPNVPEGQEIECILAFDNRGILTLVVNDSNKQFLFKHDFI